MLQTAFPPSCMNRASVLSDIRDSRKASFVRDDERCRRSKEINTPECDWPKRLGFGFICRGFKWVQEESPSNRVSGISTRTIHQSTTPSLSQTIWPRWASTQFLTLPNVHTLLPVTFGYSLSSEAVVMRQLRRWKRLWWHAHRIGLRWGLR